MDVQGVTAETLEALKSYNARSSQDRAYKDVNTSFGYVWYDLQKLVDSTFPVITPLRNSIARLKGSGGTATNWKEVYQINVNNLAPGVSEGNRNAVVQAALRSHTASYKEMGFEDSITWFADVANGELTPEARAAAVTRLFLTCLQAEERVTLYGNTGDIVSLGTPVTPTVAAAAGGSMTAQQWDVYVVALTGEGYKASKLSSASGGGIPAQLSRTNVDASSDTYGGGSSHASAAGTATTSGGNLSLACSTTAIGGALGYAWFACVHSGATSTAYLAAITTAAKVTLTTNPNTSPVLYTNNPGFWYTVDHFQSDQSGNLLEFDGMIPQIVNGGNFFDNGATPLTSDGSNGVQQIETDLLYFWNNFNLWPDTIYMNAQERSKISAIITGGSGSGSYPAYHVNLQSDLNSQGGITGGILATKYLAKYSMNGGESIDLKIHPDLPPGNLLYVCNHLPYRPMGMAQTINYRVLQEWRQIEWPMTTRKYQYGCYVNELLEMHFPLGFGLRSNISAS